jgi:pimeloyl-ACP methyl ester carboxylesterase
MFRGAWNTSSYSLQSRRELGGVTLPVGPGESHVLLVPGGASTVHGYFPQLATSLGTRATVIEVDPPGIGASSDRRPLRLAGYALAGYALGLSQAVRRTGDDPAVVVGHSLGGLVALRLAVDDPGLVAGLLLLDPTPLTPPRTLKPMAAFFKVLAGLGPVGRRGWDARARRDLRGVSMSAEQQRALAVYTHPRFLAENARWAGHLAGDGAALANDLAAGKLGAVPTVVVSAGERAPRSAIRRAHEQLVAWIPEAELQVWDGTGHRCTSSSRAGWRKRSSRSWNARDVRATPWRPGQDHLLAALAVAVSLDPLRGRPERQYSGRHDRRMVCMV